jgi:hypothetical protein
VAYTPPAWNAADFQFAGTVTPPAPTAANFGLEFVAAGIAPATQFGTPFAVSDKIEQTTGAAPSTQFGTANVYPGYVPSLGITTLFGTPNGPQRWQHVNAGPTTRIPRAYYAFAQALVSTGRSTTVFGTPSGTRIEPSGGTLGQAFGFTGTSFGAPAAAWRQDAAAAGFTSTSFGTPGYLRGGARLVTGFSRTRFGKPRSTQLSDVRYASGFTSTAFGSPSSSVKNRVASMDILSRFGTPLLNRSTTC